jgi:hypothetical protein
VLPTPFLDLTDRVRSGGNGLLSVAFIIALLGEQFFA